jgi:hypothetical protein
VTEGGYGLPDNCPVRIVADIAISHSKDRLQAKP